MYTHTRFGFRSGRDTGRVLLPLPGMNGSAGVPSFFTQGNLPATLERLQHAGLRDYYEGDIARSLAADFKDTGVNIDEVDLKNCQARIVPATDSVTPVARTT